METKAADGTAPTDAIDRLLLAAVQEDARTSHVALGRRVGLSAPAVAGRLRRLEAVGIVTGYRARLDRARLGRGLTAFIRLTPSAGTEAIDALARADPAILEAHHLTGEAGYLLKAAVGSVAELDRLILALAPFGATASQLVLATPVEDKPVAPGPDAEK